MFTINSTDSSEGLTLLELIVAIFIASFIFLGTYRLFDSVIASKIKVSSYKRHFVISSRLNKLLNYDIFSSCGRNPVYHEFDEKGNSILRIYTYHTLFLDSSAKVEVYYFVENGWLVRREVSRSFNIDESIRLIDKVTKFKVLFFTNSGYKSTLINPNLMKVKLHIDGEDYDIVVGRIE